MKRIFESFDRSPRKLGDWVRGWYYRVPEPKSLEVRGWLGKLVDYVGLGVDKGGKREWRLRGRRWDGKDRGPEIMLDELREGNVMDLMAGTPFLASFITACTITFSDPVPLCLSRRTANFFNLTLTEVAESEVLSAELWDDYVQWSELMLGKGRLFRKGYNEDLGRVCHMLDPVQVGVFVDFILVPCRNGIDGGLHSSDSTPIDRPQTSTLLPDDDHRIDRRPTHALHLRIPTIHLAIRPFLLIPTEEDQDPD